MMSVMDQNTTALERAFQLAKSGEVATIDALKRQLRAEGYSAGTITGTTLSKQLRTLIQASKDQKRPLTRLAPFRQADAFEIASSGVSMSS